MAPENQERFTMFLNPSFGVFMEPLPNQARGIEFHHPHFTSKKKHLAEVMVLVNTIFFKGSWVPWLQCLGSEENI